MYPNQECAPCATREQFDTIMAHELGHFIAYVTVDPSHYNAASTLASKLGGEPPAIVQVPMERFAWRMAHIIYPNLLPEIEKTCIGTYEDAARHELKMFADVLAEHGRSQPSPPSPPIAPCPLSRYPNLPKTISDVGKMTADRAH